MTAQLPPAGWHADPSGTPGNMNCDGQRRVTPAPAGEARFGEQALAGSLPTGDLSLPELQRRLFPNPEQATLTPEGMRALAANKRALSDEYGIERIEAMIKELRAMTVDAMRAEFDVIRDTAENDARSAETQR